MVRLVLLRLLESYFRHRWLYLLPIVLMLAVSGYYYKTIKPVYVAQGMIYVQGESLLSTINAVDPDDIPYWLSPADVTVSELTDLMQTDAFVRVVIAQTDFENEMSEGTESVKNTLEEVRSSLWAYPIGSTQVVISASHEDPKISQQLVYAASDGQLQWKINSKLNESKVAQEFFEEQIQVYHSELQVAREELKGYLEVHPAPIRGDRSAIEQLEIDRLQGAVDLAGARFASALDKDENARLVRSQIESDARQTYFMIDAPQLPEKPNTSLKEITLNLGLIVMAGVVFSGVAIVGGALLDRSFRFPIDVQTGLDLPLLASVPWSDVPETVLVKVAETSKARAIEEDEMASAVI